MSMGDFIAQQLLGFSTPSTSISHSNVDSQLSSPVPSRSSSASSDDHHQVIPLQSMMFRNFCSTFDYAAAFQLMQLQMLYQPNLFNTFFNQLTRMEALKNAYKVKILPTNICQVESLFVLLFFLTTVF